MTLKFCSILLNHFHLSLSKTKSFFFHTDSELGKTANLENHHHLKGILAPFVNTIIQKNNTFCSDTENMEVDDSFCFTLIQLAITELLTINQVQTSAFSQKPNRNKDTFTGLRHNFMFYWIKRMLCHMKATY